MDNVTMTINRKPAFCGAAMPYCILINNVERGKVMNGGTIKIAVPDKEFTLTVSVVGNSMAFHKMDKQIVLFPDHLKNGRIHCDVITKMNFFGVLFGGLFEAVGKIDVKVTYD